MGSLKFLLRKEVTQFRRNKFLPRLIFVFPVMVMLIIPLIANMEVKGVNVAFVDNDHSAITARMLSHIEASKHLKLTVGEADVTVTVPAGFERHIGSGVIPKIKIDANGVNATKGGLGSQYVMMTLAGALKEYLGENGMEVETAPEVSVRYFYNETQDYRFYMIPAFILILVLLVCCFIPALNLVMEKEKGTIEQINVTPVSPLEFTLSKLIPFWVIGLVVLTEGILTVGLVYGLWPAGSVWAIYLAAVLFALAMSGFDVTIANGSDNMQQCIFVMFFFVMIFMLMSGLLTPLKSMPDWAQTITYVFPPRYFVEILRAVYLKGTTIAELGVAYLGLIGLAIAFCAIAAGSYRKQG